MTTEPQFADRLRNRRMALGLTQEQVMERMGKDAQGSISQWENAKGKPQKRVWKSLAAALECSVEDLFGTDGFLSSNSSDAIEGGSGLEWRVVYPVGEQSSMKDAVKKGVDLIQSFLCGTSLRTLDVQETPEDVLRSYARIALTSRTLQLVSVPTDKNLAVQLQEKYRDYHLKHCVVAKTDFPNPKWVEDTIRLEAVTFLAAQVATQVIEDISIQRQRITIGFSGGSTTSRLVDLFPPAHPALQKHIYVPLATINIRKDIHVLPLIANSIVARQVYNQPGSEGAELPFLAGFQRNEKYLGETDFERDRIDIAFSVMEQAQATDMAFISVGHSGQNRHSPLPHQLGIQPLDDVFRNMRQVDKKACVGNILLYLVNENGERVGTAQDIQRNDELVYSVELKGLKRIAQHGIVWLLAASPRKSKAIHAAVIAGYCNALVIDSETAEALLQTD